MIIEKGDRAAPKTAIEQGDVFELNGSYFMRIQAIGQWDAVWLKCGTYCHIGDFSDQACRRVEARLVVS